MALFLVYLPDPIAQARLREALQLERAWNRIEHTVRYAESWAEMHELAAAFAPRLAIFDPYARGELDTESCAAFHAKFGSVILFAYGDFQATPANDPFRLAQPGLGVRGVATKGVDDNRLDLRLRVTEALSCGAAVEVLETLRDLLAPEFVPLFRHLLAEAEFPVTPAALARTRYCHPKTLRERLKAAGLPPTQHLITWTRLFRAASMFGGGRSVENVTFVLGFPSRSAFCNQLRRYAGVSPTELMERGGLEFLLAGFRGRHAAGCWDANPDQ